LGGPLDSNIVDTLHSAGVPLLLGITTGMKVLRHLAERTEYRSRIRHARLFDPTIRPKDPVMVTPCSFLAMSRSLAASGVAVVDTRLVASEAEAIAAFREFGQSVAVKAEVQGLLHKSDIGGVKLNCDTEEAVTDAYRTVLANAKLAGYHNAHQVLVQPMTRGIAEAYAGIVNDPIFGPVITLGLGGIFVEIFKDTTIEMVPLGEADAVEMIHRIKGAPLLTGARGRPIGDVDALATFLVALGEFAMAHFGKIRSLDLNPIAIGRRGEGVVAVDIAVEPLTPA
jgi:acetyltransferase